MVAARSQSPGLQERPDQEAVRLIAIYAPVARDLRVLLMIARITSELERIGDQAVDDCEYATLVSGPRRRVAAFRPWPLSSSQW